MKTMYRYVYFLLLLIGTMLLGCKKTEVLPDEPINGLGGDDWAFNALDDYLYENFVIPYNIEVKYKWDPYEVNFNRNLVPPEEAKVQPVMETVKAVWMNPYEKIGGEDFLKKYQILKYVLVGSPEYQENGTVILGTAEGGNKIILFVVNYFAKNDRAEVIRMMHTIHHEFAHILHQTIAIPQAWRTLSTSWYTATWYNTTNQQANTQGLITAYAKSTMQEDFVETISTLLVEGQAHYESVIAANPSQAATFRRKEELVVAYYKDLGIDFRQLQSEVKAGIEFITK
ncbi:substrate import-associated zinc metallohydrolase lipoprotein [Sphingobacterium sp.]|uniref:substrate import-associated zinc metallohydrolase lipoprotein n=1 Tax=Sphingobacterium sp. TaxID=341027 RepID=UPI002FDE4400